MNPKLTYERTYYTENLYPVKGIQTILQYLCEI
jgi:hypothetical protein